MCKLLLLLIDTFPGVIIGKTFLPLDFHITGISCSLTITYLHDLLITILTFNDQYWM
jgi:hypothetical protein